jgi:hypothetical protein
MLDFLYVCNKNYYYLPINRLDMINYYHTLQIAAINFLV